MHSFFHRLFSCDYMVVGMFSPNASVYYFLCMFPRQSDKLTVVFPFLPFIVSGDFTLHMLTWHVRGHLLLASNPFHPSLPLWTFKGTYAAFNFNRTRNQLNCPINLALSNWPVSCFSQLSDTLPYVALDALHTVLQFDGQINGINSNVVRKSAKLNCRKTNFEDLNSSLATTN